MDEIVITGDDVVRVGACPSGVASFIRRCKPIAAAVSVDVALRLAESAYEEEWIRKAARLIGDGDGYGYCDGYYGYGHGDGNGNGYGHGYYGNGNGDGYGNGYYGYGNGHGKGGYGYGDGYVNGNGYSYTG